MSREFALIDRLLVQAAHARADVVLGAGDDAALLAVPAGQELVASHDVLVEGVHFLPGTAARDLGWKALAVNLSDLAAMGARPAWALLSLTLPRADADFVAGFAAGFAALAQDHDVALVGGDTTSGPLAFGVTILGLAPAAAALRRSGAKPGDMVCISGALGAGAAGLHCLDPRHPQAAQLGAAPGAARDQLIERYLRPEPRVALGLALRGVASACIDLSDGLLADLGHLCRASGVGAELRLDAIPRARGLVTVMGAERAVDYVLGGGDDYELCFTLPAGDADAALAELRDAGHAVSRIGRIVAGTDVSVHADAGRVVTPRWRGWEHFG